MGSPESEIVQPCPRTYAEYVGDLEYEDDTMDGGDELPQVEIGMEMEEVPIPLVQVNGECFQII
jgi:hypothetical protein